MDISKQCILPRLQLLLGHDFYSPCCDSWINSNLMKGSPNPWEGEDRQNLIAAIEKDDYKFCRTEVCTKKFIDDIFYLDEKEKEDLKKGHFPTGPLAIILATDERCNLACPSCRTDFLTKANSEQNDRNFRTIFLIKKYSKTIRYIELDQRGEALFNKWERNLIKSFSPEKFPDLRSVKLYTNGNLLDEKMYQSLLPGSKYIKDIQLSIDAGTEDVYKNVRKGGNWNKLWDNIRWISEQKRNGVFEKFHLNVVVRKENYRTIPNLVQKMLDEKLDSALVLFPLLSLSNMGIKYFDEAIHLPGHPDHQDLKDVIKDLPSGIECSNNLF